MRYNRPAATDDWILLEAVRGERCLVSDVYADANDEELGDVFTALRLLRAAGCPPDKTKGNPEIEPVKHKCPGCHKKSLFYVLKAKPSGWRLYFRVKDEARRECEFLYAVHKKKRPRRDEDFNCCCRVADKLDSGKLSRAKLQLPAR